jgi:hypothetical protein
MARYSLVLLLAMVLMGQAYAVKNDACLLVLKVQPKQSQVGSEVGTTAGRDSVSKARVSRKACDFINVQLRSCPSTNAWLGRHAARGVTG